MNSCRRPDASTLPYVPWFADKAAQVLAGGELSYIAENGNVVAIDGNIAEVHGVDTDVTRWTIRTQ